jgi:hypothetical protein
LSDVEVPKFYRQSDHDHRWWRGCQPYAPAGRPLPQEDSWYSFLSEADLTYKKMVYKWMEVLPRRRNFVNIWAFSESYYWSLGNCWYLSRIKYTNKKMYA